MHTFSWATFVLVNAGKLVGLNGVLCFILCPLTVNLCRLIVIDFIALGMLLLLQYHDVNHSVL